jgi:hypothetical protein
MDWYSKPFHLRSIPGLEQVTFEHILGNLGIPVAAGYSPACAETCSDRIIGMDKTARLDLTVP